MVNISLKIYSASDTEDILKERYKTYQESGIVGIFFEKDSELHFRIAKSLGLQAHRWMWVMNRVDVIKDHPEWAAINRKGESTAEKPPYVPHYRWLCPNNLEVQEFLRNDVKQQLDKEYIDGIHLDFIRYSDVVLAPNLWKKRNVVQVQELPEYDYCYCATCKTKYKERFGLDLDSLEYPQEIASWRTFRYESVNNIVNDLVAVARSMEKPITSAIFPTPDIAKKLVFQDWTNWDLDAFCPMIYHGFYMEKVPWIGEAVKQGRQMIGNEKALYAGLFMPDFNSEAEIEEGIKVALENGADGISLFAERHPNMTIALELLKKYKFKNHE